MMRLDRRVALAAEVFQHDLAQIRYVPVPTADLRQLLGDHETALLRGREQAKHITGIERARRIEQEQRLAQLQDIQRELQAAKVEIAKLEAMRAYLQLLKTPEGAAARVWAFKLVEAEMRARGAYIDSEDGQLWGPDWDGGLLECLDAPGSAVLDAAPRGPA